MFAFYTYPVGIFNLLFSIMTQITLSIPEIHCMSCEMLIKLSLNKLPGIKQSSTDLKTKKVTLDFDDSVISKSKIIEQITKDTGYKVS